MPSSTKSFCGKGKPVKLKFKDLIGICTITQFLLEGDNLCVSGDTVDYVSRETKLAPGRVEYLLRLNTRIKRVGLIRYDRQIVHWNPGLSGTLYFRGCKSLHDCYLAVMNYVYSKNVWRDNECKSGTGSSVEVCGEWIDTIISKQKELGLTTWVDLCCGQFRTEVAGVIAEHFNAFLGLDISSNIIKENKKKFPGRHFRQTEVTEEKIGSILEEKKITQPVLVTIKHALQHMDKATQRRVLMMVLKTFPVGSVLVFTTFAPSVLDGKFFDNIPGGTICNCSFNLIDRSLLEKGVTFENCTFPLPDAEYVRGDGTCAVVLQITKKRKFTIIPKE